MQTSNCTKRQGKGGPVAFSAMDFNFFIQKTGPDYPISRLTL